MKRFTGIICTSLIAVFCMGICLQAAPKKAARKQWTEKQAWEWEKKVGVIKGFNEPEAGYPGMTNREILKKASEFGLNSVRFWIHAGDNVDDQIAYIKMMADDAEACGMTISPVLSIMRTEKGFDNPDQEAGLKYAEKLIKAIIRPFKDDPRIVLWDIWNEPEMGKDDPNTLKSMDWIEHVLQWCYDENLSQPLTSSIFWDTELTSDVTSEAFKRRCEVEAKMDLHNFHDYMCGENFGEDVEFTIDKVRKIGNRPLVCTECLTRVNGSDIPRTFVSFARNHVHFYIWGSFVNDMNWQVRWGRSSYDPYEPAFHDTMYADGDLYDYRNVEWIRNFKFIDKNDSIDPGLEYTDRWTHERAWKRMVGGPVKGLCINGFDLNGVPEQYNSVRVKVNYSDWAAGEEAFFAEADKFISLAKQKGITILPVLIDDNDANVPAEQLGKYVKSVIWKYYYDPAIMAWDLYWHPGEKCSDYAKVDNILTTVFKYARNCYANQPLTATPLVKVTDFAPDFDYESALIHGRHGGWNKLEYPGASDVEIVNKIWSLSDVLSFSTEQPQAEAGWLLSICYRYGRPIFCTNLSSPSEYEAIKTLQRFGMSHVFWYTGKPLDKSVVNDFRFIPIVTKH